MPTSQREEASNDNLEPVTTYFFDFRANDVFSADEDGEELPDSAAAHQAAVEVCTGTLRDGFLEGQVDQRFAVEVRDSLGPVLQVSAVLASNIFRKQ
jgi:hypothetical protein